MLRLFFFPVPSFWYLGCMWVLLTSLTMWFIARKKNRNPVGWILLSTITSFFFGVFGFFWVVLLATREKASMRMKYLGFKVEEQIADALKLPSPVGNNLEKRLLMVLAYNPQGLRIGALAQGIGQSWRHIEEVVQRLVSNGKIRKEEDRYFFNLD